MDLFNQNNALQNCLPYDGEVFYYGTLFNKEEIQFYKNYLTKQIAWENDIVKLFGKTIVTKRKVAWYASQKSTYTYSNVEKTALLFTPELLELKKRIENKTGASYNACLLNYYHNGDEGMGWHSDDEKEIIKHSAIASLSFGETRTFAFKHKKDKTRIPLRLENGSLLMMQGATQENWLHNLPKTKKVQTPRINLTFRKMIR